MSATAAACAAKEGEEEVNAPYTDIAVRFDTNEIVAVGNGILDLIRNADATGIWKKEPGTHAPYFYTAASAKEFWGAWFAPGFWSKEKGTR